MGFEQRFLFSEARNRETNLFDTKRNGRIVSVYPLREGAPMFMNNQDGSLTRTSNIETFYYEENRLTVITENTIYELIILN